MDINIVGRFSMTHCGQTYLKLCPGTRSDVIWGKPFPNLNEG